jgi:hypothetical protein
MKTFRKIEFNSSKLNNEEMKSIKAGYYGGYACNMTGTGPDSPDGYGTYYCSSVASSCMSLNGGLGHCVMTYTPGSRFTCDCE